MQEKSIVNKKQHLVDICTESAHTFSLIVTVDIKRVKSQNVAENNVLPVLHTCGNVESDIFYKLSNCYFSICF